MTAVTFPLRLPRLAFAICGWRWQNDLHEIKYSVCVCVCDDHHKPYIGFGEQNRHEGFR